MIKALVYDCDGVLLESVDAKTDAFCDLFRPHGPDAVRIIRDYHLAHGGVSRFEKFRYFYREALDQEITEAEIDSLSVAFSELCLDKVLASAEVPGARDTVEAFHGRVPQYVASGAPQEELRFILKQRSFSHYFEEIFGSPGLKTHALQEIISRHGLLPQEVLMVGDSSTDLEAAQKVGTLFYGRGDFCDPLPWGEDLRGLHEFITAHGVLGGPSVAGTAAQQSDT